MDAYLDSHFYFSGKKIVLALNIDLLDSFSSIYSELGADLRLGISTKTIDDISYRFYDFFEGDLDMLSSCGNIDMIVSNSNAKFYAENLDTPLLKAGFPIIDDVAHNYKHYILYVISIS